MAGTPKERRAERPGIFVPNQGKVYYFKDDREVRRVMNFWQNSGEISGAKAIRKGDKLPLGATTVMGNVHQGPGTRIAHWLIDKFLKGK